MSQTMTVIHSTLIRGVWEGAFETAEQPDLEIRLLDQSLDGMTVEKSDADGHWYARCEIPSSLISSGIQTFVVSDKATGAKLADFTIVAGEPLADDLRAEISLLRAELDMLKRAFRRHCLEVMS